MVILVPTFFFVFKKKLPDDAAKNYPGIIIVNDYSVLDLSGHDKFLNSKTQKILPEKLTPNDISRIKETGILANIYAPVMREAVMSLRNGDVEKLVNLTDPLGIKDVKTSTVKDIYEKKFVPFFQDFQLMNEDESIISKYLPNIYAEKGMYFEESFTTKNGKKKVFLIVIVDRNGKGKIADIYLDKTLAQFTEEQNTN